jgi:glycosyltransferase involved in cell wall biosynthesis
MKILFIAKYINPHIGGVEKHIQKITNNLCFRDNKIKTISEKNINYPHIKILGLLYIWFWLFKNRKKILESDIVHIHDVFIWYLPFKFLYPKKPVFTTFHGWEGKYPIPFINIFQKKIANKLSLKTISVGDYINKWYGIKSNIIVYGAVDKINTEATNHKAPNTIVYLGRLEKDTGLLEFLNWLKIHPNYKITFLGEGNLKGKCKEYGKILGNKNPKKYLQESEYCVPSGYLSYLEARNFNCKIMTFPNNPLKINYWDEIQKNYSKIKNVTWSDITDIYLKLWD